MKAKWKPKATKCVMVGYASGHAHDTYRMYNPVAQQVIETRDVTWADWTGTSPKGDLPVYDDPHGNLDPECDDDDSEAGRISCESAPNVPDPAPEVGGMSDTDDATATESEASPARTPGTAPRTRSSWDRQEEAKAEAAQEGRAFRALRR